MTNLGFTQILFFIFFKNILNFNEVIKNNFCNIFKIKQYFKIIFIVLKNYKISLKEHRENCKFLIVCDIFI